MSQLAKPEVRFTNREKDCLRFLVYGMTAKEIARELNISHRTVECYLQSLKEKMGCYCKSQLVMKTLQRYVQIEWLI